MTSQYTKAMIAKLEAAEPLNLAKAKSLAEEFGMAEKYRSVISKALSLGLVYQSAKPARKDGAAIAKKSELICDISKLIGADETTLVGLEKATRTGLVNLRDQIKARFLAKAIK